MRYAAYAAAALLAVAPSVGAQSLTLRSLRDATIRGGSYANANFGNDAILETRASSNATYVRRAVLMFATAEAMPSSTKISSAKLVLTVKGGNTEARTLTACAVPVSFREPNVTWRMRNATSAWKHAGGDVVTADCSTAKVTAAGGSQVVFDVTKQTQKAVQGSYGSRYARFLVGDAGGSSRGSYKQYYSNNASSAGTRPALVVTTGSTTSLPPPPETTSSGTTTLRVLQWNTHHGGYGTDGKYDPNRLATWMAKFKPDIISLNEIEYFTGWGNEDQPARFAALMKQKTGRTWYYKFATASGAAKGDGNLVLSRFPLEVKDTHLLSYTRVVVQVCINVGGRNIDFFSTHLDANSTSYRLTEIGQLTAWGSGIAEQRIVAGDFNAWPGTSENAKMTSLYYDAWAEGAKTGVAVAYPGNTAGNTRNSRIDYVYYSHGAGRLKLTKVQVFDTRDANGVMPSDHRPVMATFTIQ